MSRLAVAGFAAVGAAAVGAGVALFKLGEDFNSAFDSIQIATRATGEALEGLQADFKASLAEVPDDMQTIAGLPVGHGGIDRSVQRDV